ncbi:cellulose biosynthesis protein BcsN [Rhizobium sp. CRIBSB]|nr:cellulose biosynthesis protein BcsN [Rhizobium sp. CRIBSB]
MKASTISLVALLALTGCNTVEDPYLDGIASAVPASATGNRELPPHLAMATLTTLGETPISVRQTTVGGVTSQVIAYRSTTTIPGENRLTVAIGTAATAAFRRGPSRAELARELASEFPGIRMSLDPVVRQNGYGPYGVATGRVGQRGACVYAWQTIDKAARTTGEEASTIRLRYCHPALGTEVLAGLLSGLSFGGANVAAIATATTSYAYATGAPVADPVPVAATMKAEISAGTSAAREAADTSTSHETSGTKPSVTIPMPD